ncbi:MAG: hypothetical protein WD030_09320 [Pirellulales bacterium]
MKRINRLIIVITLLALTAQPAWSSPFLGFGRWVSFTDEFDAADAVAFAELIEVPNRQEGQAEFRIVEVLKGANHVQQGNVVAVDYLGEGPVKTLYLLNARAKEKLEWSTGLMPGTLRLTPDPVTPRGRIFIKKMLELPRDSTERLIFAFDYLEDEDEMIRRQAYHEFEEIAYERLKPLAGKLDHDKIVTWIKATEGQYRQGLYLRLLGLNGSEEDLPFLESLLTSEDGRQRGGLDYVLVCHLQLGGEDKLEFIENEYIRNEHVRHVDQVAALTALSVTAQDTKAVSPKRLIHSLRLFLDYPYVCYGALVPLQRLEDWDSMPQAVALFHHEPKSDRAPDVYERRSVAWYLLACPLPEAKKHIEELTKIDPKPFEYAKRRP